MLSEYERAEAQDRSSRGTEKNRKVVMPHASPRVGANVPAILNEWVEVCYSVLGDSNEAISESTCLVDVWFCGEPMQLTKADGMLGMSVMNLALGFVFGQQIYRPLHIRATLRPLGPSFN